MATWAKSPQYQGMPHQQYMQTAEGQKAGQFFQQDAQRMRQSSPQPGPTQAGQSYQPYGDYGQQGSLRPGQAQPKPDPYGSATSYAPQGQSALSPAVSASQRRLAFPQAQPAQQQRQAPVSKPESYAELSRRYLGNPDNYQGQFLKPEVQAVLDNTPGYLQAGDVAYRDPDSARYFKNLLRIGYREQDLQNLSRRELADLARANMVQARR